jgi:hypothetical protein
LSEEPTEAISQNQPDAVGILAACGGEDVNACIPQLSSTVSLRGIESGAKTVATWYVEFRLTQGDPEQTANAIHASVILPGFQGGGQYLESWKDCKAGKHATTAAGTKQIKTRKDQAILCRALDLS